MALKVVFYFFVLAVAVDGKQFNLTRDGEACILMDVNAVFQVQVEQNGTREASVAIDLEQLNTTVSGTCTNGTAASLNIDVEDYARWVLVFSISNEKVRLHQLFRFNASKALNNSELPTDVPEDLPYDLELSSPEASYSCQASQNLNYTTNITGSDTFFVTETISLLRVQAFNIANNSFSDPEHCPQDGITTEASNTSTVEPTTVEPTTVEPTTPTTLGPVTPPPTPAEPNTYVVNGTNATCIVLKGIIVFSNISYERLEGNETRTATQSVPVPLMNTNVTNVTVSGNCSYGSNEQQLSITFYQNWTLLMVFALPPGSTEYSVREISLNYYLDSAIFPQTNSSGASRIVENLNITSGFMKGSTSGSYKCDSKLSEDLSGGVKIETSDLQYKAFNKDFNTDFSSDNVDVCSEDDKSNSIVPIVVGASLAGLVVIVLIAYLIGRRRSRRTGYESV